MIMIGSRNLYQDFRLLFTNAAQTRTRTAFFLFLLATVSFGWFAFSVDAIFNDLNSKIIDSFSSERPRNPYVLALPSAVLLLVSILLNGWFFLRKKPIPSVDQHTPEPHPGLIYMLSKPLKVFGKPGNGVAPPASTAELEALLMNRNYSYQDLRNHLLFTNWGPFFVALEHHREKLEFCWVIVTEEEDANEALKKENRELTALARRLVQRVARRGNDTKVKTVMIDDPNHVQYITPRIKAIYDQASNPSVNLNEDQIIADFTGGTKAMTAAMILATIIEQRKLQYLVQNKDLTRAGIPRTYEELRNDNVLVEVKTFPSLLPPFQ